MIKTANNIILQKAEPDMYTARDLDEVSTKLPSEKKTKLTSSGEVRTDFQLFSGLF